MLCCRGGVYVLNRGLPVGSGLLDGLTFKVADVLERDRAFELRGRVYREELGHDGLDGFDEHAHHLIAIDRDGKLLAALRIVGPDQRPFDMERLVTLADFLPGDRVPGELSRFCVDPAFRRVERGSFVHLGMFKLAHSFARKHGLTDFVTLALPHLRNGYRVGFFRSVGPDLIHPTWGPVSLMHLDLIDLKQRYGRSSRPMARLLFEDDPPNIRI